MNVDQVDLVWFAFMDVHVDQKFDVYMSHTKYLISDNDLWAQCQMGNLSIVERKSVVLSYNTVKWVHAYHTHYRN